MQPLEYGSLTARLAETSDDLMKAQQLRYLAFKTAHFGLLDKEHELAGGFPLSGGVDADDYDTTSQHILIFRNQDLVGCYRFNICQKENVFKSYSARFYDLARLSFYNGVMMEIGRFCIYSRHLAPTSQNRALEQFDKAEELKILYLAWASITYLVIKHQCKLLFGCASLPKADPALHVNVLRSLIPYVAPQRWRPKPLTSSPHIFFDDVMPPPEKGDISMIPGLLRSYLSMGGRVSDHAVLDSELDTIHVFTGVETDHIPKNRQKFFLSMLHRSSNMGY